MYIFTAIVVMMLFNFVSHELQKVEFADLTCKLIRTVLAGIGVWWVLHQIF